MPQTRNMIRLAVFLTITLFSNCFEFEDPNLTTQKGVLDLRRVIFERNNGIPVSGEWEFFWQEFIPSEGHIVPNPIYNRVPSSWNTNLDSDGSNYSRDGYASYRVTIRISEAYNGRNFTLLIPEISSAYKLYSNGYLVAEQGKIDSDFQLTKPWIKPRLLKIKAQPEIVLIFHISNFGYNDGGFWSNIEIGLEESMARNYNLSVGKEIFLFGSILIMGLYHIGFYFFRRSEKSILYFSIFCFLISIRTIVTGNRVFLDFFPGINWDIFYRLEYISFYAAPAPFFLFVKSLYGTLMSRYINKYYIIITLSFIPITLLPVYIFTQTVNYFQVLTLLGVIYVFGVIIRATWKGRQGAILFLIGWIAMASTVIYDIVIDMMNIRSVYFASYGFIIFIFSQSLILSSKFSRAFKAAEDLSRELTKYKTNLENMVEERTQDIRFLNTISKEVNSTFDLNHILQKVYEYVKEGFGIESIWMLNVDSANKILTTEQWVGFNFLNSDQERVFSEFTVPLNETGGTLYRTFTRKKLFYLPRIKPEMVEGYDRVVVELLNLSSFIQIPLVVQGEVVAILCATSYSNGLNLKKAELSVLASIAEQIAGAVNNSILLERAMIAKRESEQSSKEAEKLAQLSIALSSNSSLEKIFDQVADYLKENFNLNYHWLLLVNKEENCLYTSIFNDDGHTEKSIKEKYLKMKIPLKPESGSLYGTYSRKKHFYLPKIPNRGIEGFDQVIINDLNLRSFIQLPILVNNEVEGILTMTNFGDKLKLSQNDLRRIIRFNSQIAGAIYNTGLLSDAEKERNKSNQLLKNILPDGVAEELKNTGTVVPVQYESTTILFTDFKGFTKIAESMTPNELINQLDGAFLQFDEISERFNLEKLKTIGDAYMSAGGLPIPNQTHPYDVCLAALEICAFMDQVKFIREKIGQPSWEIRIGIHTGPVIAGVIGKKKFAYDIWGDAVNIASRMESAGVPGKVNISEATYELVKDFFVCTPRGSIDVKNKGEMGMYFLERIREDLSARGEGKIPNKHFYHKILDITQGTTQN
ncbi:adenylate/guanylate cyclase domain-containing protein [Leptospira sp. GIMC2001]|uniref:adenylate/guanylate cyclase domain-containing protein n=1 Tax=Leptospira sp. GIMC2001 TaxID=1513297 RepID=UPI00234BD2B5|nr:adenylate/guanylate cyclase domain-containing protein [Leptospira sp. GIMC2001]WCL48896.1 hypothetical protein O4O04_16580 [Leptospira sp. GIMC2001]